MVLYFTCQNIGGAIKGTTYTKLAKIGGAMAPPAPPVPAPLHYDRTFPKTFEISLADKGMQSVPQST